MKKYRVLGIVMLALLTLGACTNRSHYQTIAQHNYLKETWMYKVNTNPAVWKRNTSKWFLTGDPSELQKCDLKAPSYETMSIMNVHPTHFNNITIHGNFQIQLIGAQDHNSVNLLGPNKQIRQIIISTRNNTLYLKQNQDPHANTSLDKVIVRIGVRDLHNLTIAGLSTVEGRTVTGRCVVITSIGNNHIILEGNMNVLRINQIGGGDTTVMGANTPVLHLNVHGNGNVNVSGNVGIQTINHKGDGAVTIIGANTDGLSIIATGCGLTSVAGYVNLKQINASNNSRVYVYWVNSDGAAVFATDHAHVGNANITTNITVELFKDARFRGSYLHGDNVFLRAHDWSHANIESDNRLFAAAYDNSSIYYLGSPTEVSRYDTRHGVILPIGNAGAEFPRVAFAPPVFPCPVIKPSLKAESPSSIKKIKPPA